jgi:hypothetical protein
MLPAIVLSIRVKGPMPGSTIATAWGMRIVLPIRMLALPYGLPARNVPEW